LSGGELLGSGALVEIFNDRLFDLIFRLRPLLTGRLISRPRSVLTFSRISLAASSVAVSVLAIEVAFWYGKAAAPVNKTRASTKAVPAITRFCILEPSMETKLVTLSAGIESGVKQWLTDPSIG